MTEKKVAYILEHVDECRKFTYRYRCCGGCRALGLAFTEDVFGPDQSKYLFFEGDYLQKLDSALSGYYSAYKQIIESEN